MTITEFRDFIVSVDPTAQHYASDKRTEEAYTIWRELSTLPYLADGKHVGAQRYQVDRFTKTEYDDTAKALFDAIESRDDITCYYAVDYERDTGYIHHIYDLEVC